MPVTAAQLEAKFNQIHSAKSEQTISPAYAIQSSPGRRLGRQAIVGGGATYFTAGAAGAARAGDLTEAAAAALLTRHDRLTFGSQDNSHLGTLTDPLWRKMYHYQDRALFFQTVAGAVGLGPLLPCFPCHYCGIVLPQQLVQVDHQLPQRGAPGAAILKTLHSLNAGLTLGDAHGAKNRQMANIANDDLAALIPVPVKGRPFGQIWAGGLPLPAGPKQQRYTLTPQGVTFLTIAFMYTGSQNFTLECINSFLNLVPACAACNNAKRNLVHAR